MKWQKPHRFSGLPVNRVLQCGIGALVAVAWGQSAAYGLVIIPGAFEPTMITTSVPGSPPDVVIPPIMVTLGGTWSGKNGTPAAANACLTFVNAGPSLPKINSPKIFRSEYMRGSLETVHLSDCRCSFASAKTRDSRTVKATTSGSFWTYDSVTEPDAFDMAPIRISAASCVNPRHATVALIRSVSVRASAVSFSSAAARAFCVAIATFAEAISACARATSAFAVSDSAIARRVSFSLVDMRSLDSSLAKSQWCSLTFASCTIASVESTPAIKLATNIKLATSNQSIAVSRDISENGHIAFLDWLFIGGAGVIIVIGVACLYWQIRLILWRLK